MKDRRIASRRWSGDSTSLASEPETELDEAPMTEAELERAESASRGAHAAALDRLVVEARGALAPEARNEANAWASLERRLAEPRPRSPAPITLSRQDRTWRTASLVFMAAAGVLLALRGHRASDPVATTPPHGDGPAVALRGTEGSGKVAINGVAAREGNILHVDDVIGAAGARAVFDRPRQVTWLLEADSPSAPAEARVTSTGEPFVLGLTRGAIEAQVVPVKVGEAFAVDLATEGGGRLRVAVHGTHLRVARAGDRVTVDLTEGVIAIGVPPAEGITHGTTVTAPAHVEIDVRDPTSMRVDHDPASVRVAVPLGDRELEAARSPTRSPAPDPKAPPREPPTALTKGSVLRPDEGASAAHPSAALPHALPPIESIKAQIRACAQSVPRDEKKSVHVTVTSALELQIAPNGAVASARFSPPLLPEIQSCAAAAIYKTNFPEAGAVTIPIEFSF